MMIITIIIIIIIIIIINSITVSVHNKITSIQKVYSSFTST